MAKQQSDVVLFYKLRYKPSIAYPNQSLYFGNSMLRLLIIAFETKKTDFWTQ